MAASNRKASFLATMAWEGRDRLSRDPRDPGNWTGGKVGVGRLVGSKFGVSAATAARCFPGKAMADLTADDALEIFVDGYWTPVGADAMPVGLDHSVADDAYNAGPAAALRRWRRGGFAKNPDPATAIHAYAKLRLSFLEALRGWRFYQRGWAARVAGVEAESVKMVYAAEAAVAHPSMRPGDYLAAKSLVADQAATRAHKTALAAASVALLTPAASSHANPVAAIVVAAAVCTAVHQFWTAHVHAARRDALGEAADEANGASRLQAVDR
jgi:lysozyme family protein